MVKIVGFVEKCPLMVIEDTTPLTPANATSGTLFSNVNNIQFMIPEDQQ